MPFVFPADLVPKSGGSSFSSLPAVMTVILVDGNELEIKSISLNNKPSNEIEFNAVLYDAEDNFLEGQTSKGVRNKILVKTKERVSKIKITITKTKNGLAPRFVELSIKACHYPITSTPTMTTSSALFSTLSTSSTNLFDLNYGLN